MAKQVSLSIRYLAEFMLRRGSIDNRMQGGGMNRALQGSRIHRMLQRQAGPGYKAEVALSCEVEQDGLLYHLSGRADGVLEQDGRLMVDEIKTVVQPLEAMDEDAHPEHWAQGCIYAYILAKKQKRDAVDVQLTYYNVDTDELRRMLRSFTAGELEEFLTGLLAGYRRWAELGLTWAQTRNESLQQLQFPFDEYREGQRGMAVASYNTFKTGGRLFCCAPTGIGKTISTLFPAMKALGEGFGERIFYLTAKTITRKAAEDTIALLRSEQPGLQFHSITLTAKDKICMLDTRNCNPEACRWADGYYDRVNDAVYEILARGGALSREDIEAYAAQYQLCPYELSLDLSSWCDCIVCDYNYLFDPVVHLQRFFEGNGGDYLFLVDEAHNLVDRSRDMYSAHLAKSPFFALKKALPKQHRRLHEALGGLNKAFVELRHACEGENTNVLVQREPPTELEKPLQKFTAAAEAFLEDNRGSELEPDLLAMYFEALFYVRILEEYDDTYITLVYKRGSEVTAKLFCLDPAHFLEASMNLGRAAVLFSATLLPLGYYRETLGGGPTAKLLALESPFDPARLGLYVADGVSTKYADREDSLPAVCQLLYTMASARQGNYIAYFPSYSYMRTAHELFCQLYPDIPTLEQTTGMDEAEREAFLASFGASPTGTLLGFCVLGGIFAEGVDLAGDRLIGTAIVGVGLPQIGPEPDALRDYYNEKNGCGFEYAYQFPGMNKVLQAAGRVIRGENDRGVVLLVDSRFTTYRYQEMFPQHWGHWQRTSHEALPGQLEAFWAGGEDDNATVLKEPAG